MVESRPFRFVAAFLVTMVATACGSRGPMDASTDARADAAWPCPPDWVRYERGGCGPAILLCVPDGGAAPHACDGVDLSRPHVTALPDGGTTTRFYRLPDGGIGGSWPADDWVPTGVPAEGWAPDSGIPSCPTGWQRTSDDTCEPALRTTCPVGSDPLPAGECTPTATSDCPTTEFADVTAESIGARVGRVRAGADPSGADGSTARPFPSVGAAVTAVGDGGWVLIGQGIFDETISVTGMVHIVGRCAAQVTLAGAPDTSTVGSPTIAARGAAARLDLRGVQVRGGGFGVSASGGAHVSLRNVSVDHATQYGVNVDGSGTEATLEGSRVASTRAVSVSGGMGVVVLAGARATVRRTAFVANGFAGLAARGTGSRLVVSDAVVRGTLPSVDGMNGFGLTSQQGALVAATTVLLEDNRAAGVFSSSGARIDISDSVVRGTRPRRDESGGYGLQSQDGGTLVATRVLVAENQSAAAYATSARSVLEVHDCVLRGTRARRDGTGGSALSSQFGASIVASGTLLVNNRDVGALAFGAAARLDLIASVVRDTAPRTDASAGYGLLSQDGATLTAAGVLVVDNTEAGVAAEGNGSRVELRDCIVRRTHARADGTGGFGLVSHQGATLTATRMVIADNHSAGVYAATAGATLELSDSVVRGTTVGGDHTTGEGITSQQGATLVATRVLVSENASAGALAIDGGSRIEIRESVVRRTRENANGRSGYGLTSQGGAMLLASAVLVADNHAVGAYVASGDSRLELHHSEVRNTLSSADGTGGYGILVHERATLTANGVLLRENREIAIWGSASESRLDDIFVTRVGPGLRGGLGAGVVATDGARLVGARISVIDVGGFAVASVPRIDGSLASQTALTDLFIVAVRPSNVNFRRFDASRVAYGLFAGRECALDATHAVIDTGAWGFFRSLGTLTLRDAVITRQDHASGATNGTSATAPLTLDNVVRTGNATDDVLHDVDLVEIDLPPAPQACLRPPCM